MESNANKINVMKYHLKKASPDLFLAGGVLCIIGGGLFAIKQTPKAIKILEKKKEENNVEKTKAVAPLYIPSIILTGVGVASIICSRNMTNRKLAAMTTAYTMSETAYKSYKNKVKDMVEEEKYEEINKEVNRDVLSRNSINDREVHIKTSGDVLFFDNMTSRYFKSSVNEIDKVVNLLNKRLRNEMTIQLNDFYSEIGLPLAKVGCDIGWDIKRGEIEINTNHASIADDGQPCIVLDYDCWPI